MSKTISRLISLIVGFSLTGLSVNVSAELPVPIHSLTMLSPVYKIDRKYKSMEGPSASQPLKLEDGMPSELVWITGFRTEIVGEDGSTPMSQEFMCHINLDTNIGNHGRLFGWTKVVSPRLFTLSQAQFDVKFPDGFAMPFMSDEAFTLATQVLNHNFENANFKVRHKVTVEYVRDRDLTSPMKPLFPTNAFGMRLLKGDDGHFGMPPAESSVHGPSCAPGLNAKAAGLMSYPDQYGRKFSGHWVVKRGREVDHTNVTKVMNIPFDTTIHFINIHLHPFAESLELKDLTTGKTVFHSNIKNPRGRIGLEHVESYSSAEGIPVYKDHEYDLIAVYNNTSGVEQDAMATMFLYLLDKEFKKPTAAVAAPGFNVNPAQASVAAHAPRLVLHTMMGDMTFKLYPDIAPQTVAHIVELAKAGAYDTTHFYRVEPGFVVQTALVNDRTVPLTPSQTALIHKVPAEFSQIRHARGVLSMARETDDINSGESSFSILLGPAPHLDGKYTIFGELEKGFDVLNKIEHVEISPTNQPRTRLEIKKAEVLANPV